MKRSTKIKSIILIFFAIIVIVIVGRSMIGMHFQKKFSKRPPPGIIVKPVEERKFENTIETFGTAVSSRIKSYNVEKYEILDPIKFNTKVKSGEVIAKLKNRDIVAPFDGILGKRDFSNDLDVSQSTIVINLEDTSFLFVDVDIPETLSSNIKKGLSVDVTYSGNENKNLIGEIDSIASRINTDKRSLRARIKVQNKNLEILPGSLLEVAIKYNERNSLGIPDTSVILEGNKVYVYKVSKDNIANRVEIKIGNRNNGFLEVKSGLKSGEVVVAEGLKKVRPRGKIKPIKK